MDKKHTKFFIMDIYQMLIFQQWNHTTLKNTPTTTEADIVYNITEEEWYRFYND